MGESQEGEGCNVLLPLPLLGGALCYFLSTRTESRLVLNDKMSILCYTASYSIPQAEYEWRVCFDGNAVILRYKQRKNIKHR